MFESWGIDCSWQLLFSWSVRLQRWSGKHDAVCMTSSILYCGSQGRSVTGTYLTAVWTCRALIYPKICCEQASDHGHDLHSAPRALLMEPYKTPLLLVQFGGSRFFRFMGFVVYNFNHHFGIQSIFLRSLYIISCEDWKRDQTDYDRYLTGSHNSG